MKIRRLTILATLLIACNLLAFSQTDRQLQRQGENQSEKRTALVIGNGSYKQVPSLDNPVNDATDIAAALKGLDFEVITGTDRDLVQMSRLIREFGKKLAQNKGVGLFYYAGHGVEVSGRNFLIPVDADIARESETQYNAIDVNLILTEMDDANNGFNIVILDACRNNPFSRGWSRGVDTGGLASVNAPTGTYIAYAAAPGKTASDGTGTRNGIFTGALLKNLKRPGLKLEEVFKATREEVMALTRRKQVPWELSSFQGDFYFFPKLAEPKAQPNATAIAPISTGPVPKPTPLPTPTPVPVAQTFDAEGLYWTEISRRDTRSGYELYVAEYPTGKYVTEARNRINNFKQEELERLKGMERAKWRDAQNLDTRDGYNAYLVAYPNGEFATAARAGIKALETKDERAKWRDAQDRGTKEGYNAYLTAYPNGEFADEARTGIKALETKEEQAKWDEVQILNRKSAFQSYLTAYPSGKYAMAARQKINEFDDAEAVKKQEQEKATEKAKWDEAERVKTVVGYKEYLTSYPAGEFASFARLRLRDLGEVVVSALPSTLTSVFWNRAPESQVAFSRSVENEFQALAVTAQDQYRRDDFYAFDASALNALHAGGSLEFRLQHHDNVVTREQLHPVKLTITARTISFDPQLQPGIFCSFTNFTIPIEQVIETSAEETSRGFFSKMAGVYLKLKLLNSKDPKKPHTLNFVDPNAFIGKDSKGISIIQSRSEAMRALTSVSTVIRSMSSTARSLLAAEMPRDVILESSRSDNGENTNVPLPSVDSIIESYIKANGNAAKWTTEIRKGFYTVNAITRSFEIYIKARTKYSSVYINEKNEKFYESGYDGSLGWSKTNKEKPKRMDPSAEMALQRDLKMDTLADVREFNKIYPISKLKGRGKLENLGVYVVEANLSDGRTETFYFDTTTGLLVRRDIKSADPKKKGETILTILIIDEYAEMDGTKRVVAWRQVSPTVTISFKITEASLNSPIDDVRFKMPDK